MREKRRVLGLEPAQPVDPRRIDRDPPPLHEDDAVAALERQGRPLLRDQHRTVELRCEIEQRLRRFRIELGGRLVEQEEPGTKREGRGDTHPLELAGRELVRLPACQMLGSKRTERLESAAVDLRRRRAEVLEPEGNLVLDPGEDDLVLGILKDARNAPGEVARPRAAGVAAVHLDPPREPAAVKVRHETGERTQQRGLSRAGRAQEADELAGPELERDVRQGRRPGVRVAVRQVLDAR